MISDLPAGFRAEFAVDLPLGRVWDRLTASPTDSADGYWLPGFDATGTVIERADSEHLLLRKDSDPCGGSTIQFSFVSVNGSTSVTVSQTDFGDWFEQMRDILRSGWRHIAADIEAFLATGVHPARHMRWWGDLGADLSVAMGGVHLGRINEGGLASALAAQTNDLLVVLAGAPVCDLDDVATILRVVGPNPAHLDAEVVRDGNVAHLSISLE
jgi:hypothetical protein